jgi:hypothetical protein
MSDWCVHAAMMPRHAVDRKRIRYASTVVRVSPLIPSRSGLTIPATDKPEF